MLNWITLAFNITAVLLIFPVFLGSVEEGQMLMLLWSTFLSLNIVCAIFNLKVIYDQ